MAIATGTALAIAAGASAGASIYGAHKAGKASKEAAAQQQQGTREARAYAEPLYGQALQIAQQQAAQGQAGLAPYAQQGGQGLTALTALLGLPAGTAAPRAPGAVGAGVVPMGQTPPPSQLGGMVPMPPVPSGTAAPATASSYVTLRAPTGEMRQVSADQAGFFLARGAQRV